MRTSVVESEAGRRTLLVLVMIIGFSTLLVMSFAPSYWLYAMGLAVPTGVLWVASMTRPERADLWAHTRVLVILALFLAVASAWLVLEPRGGETQRRIQTAVWGGIAAAALLVMSWQALSLFREIWRQLKAERATSPDS